jgi:hypothetical protein
MELTEPVEFSFVLQTIGFILFMVAIGVVAVDKFNPTKGKL